MKTWLKEIHSNAPILKLIQAAFKYLLLVLVEENKQFFLQAHKKNFPISHVDHVCVGDFFDLIVIFNK